MRAQIVGGGAGQRRDLRQRLTRGGGGARDLVDQHRAGDTPAAVGRHGGAQRDVVGHDHHLGGDALGAGQLRGEAEVQPVTRVVLYDQDGAGRARGGADAGEHGVHARRGEDVAGDGGRQQAGADIARMGRLMPGAAARKQRHVTVRRDGETGSDDNVLVGQQGKAGMEVTDALEHLAHDMARIVDELLHGESSLFPQSGPSALG
jgi:hypothetical protein